MTGQLVLFTLSMIYLTFFMKYRFLFLGQYKFQRQVDSVKDAENLLQCMEWIIILNTESLVNSITLK